MGKNVKDVPMTDKSPEPMKRGREKNLSEKGILKWATLMRDAKPEAKRLAEMAYCSRAGQKGNPQTANRKTTRGGVMRPPTIAKQCCNPMSAAKRMGRGSSIQEIRQVVSLKVSSPDTQHSKLFPPSLTSSVKVKFGIGLPPRQLGDAHIHVVVALAVAQKGFLETHGDVWCGWFWSWSWKFCDTVVHLKILRATK
jgi:hypothetical protein